MHEQFGIEWTEEEEAKIRECQTWAVARRMVTSMSRNGDSPWGGHRPPSFTEMTRRIYREITGE